MVKRKGKVTREEATKGTVKAERPQICFNYNARKPEWMDLALKRLKQKDGRGPSVAWSAGIIRNGCWNISETLANEYIERLPNAFVQEHLQIGRGEPPRRYFTMEYVRELNHRFATTRGIQNAEKLEDLVKYCGMCYDRLSTTTAAPPCEHCGTYLCTICAFPCGRGRCRYNACAYHGEHECESCF